MNAVNAERDDFMINRSAMPASTLTPMRSDTTLADRTSEQDDLLRQVDIVVDCSPKHIGAQNKARYQAAGVKAIWQGGEPHELAGYSFVAQANYAGAVGLAPGRRHRARP